MVSSTGVDPMVMRHSSTGMHHALPGLTLPAGEHLRELTDKEDVEQEVEKAYIQVGWCARCSACALGAQ